MSDSDDDSDDDSKRDILDDIIDLDGILEVDKEIYKKLRKTTAKVVAEMTPRERKVLCERFGIDKLTPKGIGSRFEITRERIKEIERRFAKLKPDQDPEDSPETD